MTETARARSQLKFSRPALPRANGSDLCDLYITSSDSPNSRSAVLVSSVFDFVWSGATGTSKVTVSFRPGAEAKRLTTLSARGRAI